MNDEQQGEKSLPDYRRDFIRNLKEGVRIYRKLERRALIGCAISILMAIGHVVLMLGWDLNLLLGALSGGGVGLALSSWHGCIEIENIPMLGYLVVLNKRFTPEFIDRREQDEEHQRMVWQQFEDPGFEEP